MNKTKKMLSGVTTAALLASSAIVPAAVAAADSTAAYELQDVVVNYKGQLVSYPIFDYLTEQDMGDIKVEADYVRLGNGEVYEIFDYLQAYAEANNDDAKTYEILKSEYTKVDKEVVDGKVVNGEIVPEKTTETPAGDLKVESVKAINPTTIQVTFNGDLTEAQAAKENFTLSKGTVEAVKVEGKVATISVKGLTYGNTTTVTVGSPAHTAEVTVPQVNELYVLEVTTDAANDTIKSDGATKTQLTVVLKDRTTGEIVEKDGVIQFQATRGGLGQTTSALQNGKATVQLTSVASATSMTSIVTATVSDVPGAAEFEGLTAQKAVIFSPEATEQGEVKFVKAVSAESTQGDRLHVTFSDKISAADYKKAIADKATTKGKPTSLEYGIEVDGKTVAVKDVVNLTDNTLEFILDVDHANPTLSPSSHQRIEQTPTWTSVAVASGQKNYLRDNVNHKVSFPANVGSVVLADPTGVTFMLTDTSRPAVLGVTAKDQLEFNVRFTESVDERTVEAAPQNFLIDGREVVINDAAKAADIVKAKNSNKIIVTSLKVGEYTFDKDGKPVDQRNIVTFKVHKDFALTEGVHQIQVAKVQDWAGDVDPVQNTVATDTFDFSVTADKSVPTPTIEVQSPEQWKVTFDKEVYGTTGKKIKDVFAIKSADSNDSFVMDTDYIVSYINEDGTTGTKGTKLNHTDDASKLNGEQHFLIEFTQDWTEKYETNNNPEKTYFASTKNPYTVTVDNVESVIGNKMAKQELDVKLSYDGVSPTIAEAKQIEVNGTLTSDVRVKMSEPVKNVATMNNNETLTPSEQQQSSTGVPVPTYEFVKGDKVVKAKAKDGSYDNYSFTLEPAQTLEPGEWTLYIRSISDDIGNTSATESKKVVIEKPAAGVATKTSLSWAAFDNSKSNDKLLNDDAVNNYDVIYVKFTKEMKSDGTNGVSRTQNYVFMGQPLPAGSQVLKGIQGVTQDWDGATIIMPANTWNGTGTSNNDFTTSLNIASNFVAADGEALSGAYEVELTDTLTTSVATGGFEAIYNSTKTANTFAGVATVKSATATATKDKIDTIILAGDTGQSIAVTAPRTKILVNGKTFEQTAADVFKALPGQEITGTDAKDLKVTALDGSIIVNTGSVKDAAAPVITDAVLNAGKDKITVTFSEAVTNKNDGTFEKVEASDFTISGGTVTDVEHDSSTPNKVVLTITGGATLTTASTIAATLGGVKDFAGKDASTAAFSPIKGAIAVTGITAAKGTQVTSGNAGSPFVAGTPKKTTTVVNAPSSAGVIKVVAAGTTKDVTLSASDTVDEVATKIATAFTGVGNAPTGFTVTAETGGKVVLTADANADDSVVGTATVTITDDDSTGATVATSTVVSQTGFADTLPVPATKQKDILTVSAGTVAAGTVEVTVTIGATAHKKDITIVAADTAVTVATKIATAFSGAGAIAGWTATANGADVEFEADAAAANVTFTVATANK